LEIYLTLLALEGRNRRLHDRTELMKVDLARPIQVTQIKDDVAVLYGIS